MSATSTLLNAINGYWARRSESFSIHVQEQLDTQEKQRWKSVVCEVLDKVLNGKNPQQLHVCDLGCGPGFFSILTAEMGCHVSALDYCTSMLEQAKQNARRAKLPDGAITFYEADALHPPFHENTFDVLITRNLTWTLIDPTAAYRAWHRILKPGGVLINFDANWYSYLYNEAQNAQRLRDQQEQRLNYQNAEGYATKQQCDECEQLALQLPLSRCIRPAWDKETLTSLHFSKIQLDTNVYKRVWSPEEQAFYASSPQFMIVGVK